MEQAQCCFDETYFYMDVMSSAYIGIWMYKADVTRQWGMLMGIPLLVSAPETSMLIFDWVGHTSNTALHSSIKLTAKRETKLLTTENYFPNSFTLSN